MAEKSEMRKQFRSAFHGYNREDVTAFIEEFNASYMKMEEYYRGLLSEKSAQLEAAQTENAILKKKTVQAVLEKEKAEAAGREAAKRAENAEKELRLLQTAVDGHSEELRAAKEDAETARSALVSAQEALSSASGDSETQEKLRETLASELEETKGEVSALQTRLCQSEEEKAALQKELSALQESFDSVVDAAKVSLDDSQALLAAQNERLTSLEKELQEAKLTEKSGVETSEEILEKARKEAEEIIQKAKNTAQLIQISAIRKKDAPQTAAVPAPAGKKEAAPADSVQSSIENLSRSLHKLYGGES